MIQTGHEANTNHAQNRWVSTSTAVVINDHALRAYDEIHDDEEVTAAVLIRAPKLFPPRGTSRIERAPSHNGIGYRVSLEIKNATAEIGAEQ